MRHLKSKKILDRKRGPRRALLRTLAISLITHKQITTTRPRANVIRTMVEKMITKAKAGDLSARRSLLRQLGNESAVKELVEKVAPAVKNRPGGYIRVSRVAGGRAGDDAHLIRLEILNT